MRGYCCTAKGAGSKRDRSALARSSTGTLGHQHHHLCEITTKNAVVDEVSTLCNDKRVNARAWHLLAHTQYVVFAAGKLKSPLLSTLLG